MNNPNHFSRTVALTGCLYSLLAPVQPTTDPVTYIRLY